MSSAEPILVRSIACGVLALGLGTSCLGATTLRVSAPSEVDCAVGARVAVVVAATSEELRTRVPSGISTRCVPRGDGLNDTGSVVLTPAGSKDEGIAFALMTRPDGEAPETCTDTAQSKQCIVARRELRFVPHETISVPVELRLSCLGVTCPSGQTCRRGACVGDVVATGCGDACSEGDLGVTTTPTCGSARSLEPGAAWPAAGYCGTRPGRSGRLGPQHATVRWKFDTGGVASMSPSVGADGTVYVGSNARKLFAVTADGSLLWSTALASNINDTGVIVGSSAIYVGCADGKVYAFSKGGALLWRTSIAADVAFPIVIDGEGTIFASGLAAGAPVDLYALATDGSVRFHVPGPFGGSAPTIAQNGTVYVGGSNGSLVALRPSDGGTVWTAPTETATTTPSVGDDGTVYVTDTGALYAFDPNGERRWSLPLDGISRGVAIAADSTVLVATEPGTLFAVGASGTIRWKRTIAPFTKPPIVGSDGTSYLGSNDGSLYAVSADGNVRWSVPTGSGIHSQPALGADGTLYVASGDGSLYAIGP